MIRLALALVVSAIATVVRGQFATVIDVPPAVAPASIGAGTQLNLADGGTLPSDFNAETGSELNIAGGTVGQRLRTLAGSTANITGGKIADDFDMYGVVNISGGTIGAAADLIGTAFISGGSIGQDFDTVGIVHMSGGSVDGYTDVYSGSQLRLTGGVWNSPLAIRSGSVTFVGGDFRVNGVPIGGLDHEGDAVLFDLLPGSLLSGTLANGTPFHYTSLQGDEFVSGAVTLERSTPPLPSTTLFHVPTDAAPLSIREGQTLILDDGGNLPTYFRAGRASSVSVLGGQVGERFETNAAQIAISGGKIGERFAALGGSHVSLSAGTVARYGRIVGSVLDMTGGTLGTDAFVVGNGEVNLSGGMIAKNFVVRDSVVNITGGQIESGVRIYGASQFNVMGGYVDVDAIAYADATVNVSGGVLAGAFVAEQGSVTNVTGGHVGLTTARYGSRLNVSGGHVYKVVSHNNSEVNLSGGTIEVLDAGVYGRVAISGGSIGDRLITRSYSDVLLNGAEFRLNGTLLAGLDDVGNEIVFNLPAEGVLSGTLADGTPFAFSSLDGDSITPGTLSLKRTVTPTLGPALIQVPIDAAPPGIRGAQTLVLETGGIVGNGFNAGRGSTTVIRGGTFRSNFEAVAASVHVAGGQIGEGFDAFDGTVVDVSAGRIDSFASAYDSRVNVTGGTVGQYFQAFSGSRVDISGGAVDGDFTARSGAVVNVAGGWLGISAKALSGSQVNVTSGSVGIRFLADVDSQVNVSGGSVGESFEANAGAEVNLSGGFIGPDFDALAGSKINVYGTSFLLDGVPIAGLSLNSPFIVTTRNKKLSGVLADGSSFDFQLNSIDTGADYFDRGAILKVIRVAATIPGDYNHNGNVDAADYVAWRDSLGQAITRGGGADGNFNGTIDPADYFVWRSNFGRSASGLGAGESLAVPEVPTFVLSILAVVMLTAPRHGVSQSSR
jgi:hypothetical protein